MVQRYTYLYILRFFGYNVKRFPVNFKLLPLKNNIIY